MGGSVGPGVAWIVGLKLGALDGRPVGGGVGGGDGPTTGESDGEKEGEVDGHALGTTDGRSVGDELTDTDGASLESPKVLKYTSEKASDSCSAGTRFPLPTFVITVTISKVFAGPFK